MSFFCISLELLNFDVILFGDNNPNFIIFLFSFLFVYKGDILLSNGFGNFELLGELMFFDFFFILFELFFFSNGIFILILFDLFIFFFVVFFDVVNLFSSFLFTRLF